MGWADGTDLQEHDLRIGETLGTGGQGKVYTLRGHGEDYVYKEYLSPDRVNGAALKRLVDIPGRLTESERERLLRQSAWPLARVLDGGRVKGFIMHKVGPEFWSEAAGKPRLLELQYLLYEPKPMWGDIVPLDADDRLEFVRQAASLFSLLHSKNLVVGDVSMRNVLWSPAPVGVFLLDCDGIREVGTQPVMPQPETPDWTDPQQPPSGPDLDTDRYKLALLVARVLARMPEVRPGEPLTFVPGLPERVMAEVTARFKEAACPRGLRPDAARWIMALSDRGTIDLPPLPPVRTLPNLPKAPLEGGRKARGTIALPPPGRHEDGPTSPAGR